MAEDLENSPYQHLDLDPSTSEIRLIRLLPADYSDRFSRIKCELFIANLDHFPHYEALSYEWRNAGPDEPYIQLNGRKHSIRENLWQALYHLRLCEQEPRIIWIDALCINQSAISEKNHQVAQMGKIYRQAEKVVAWIGIEDHSDMSTKISTVTSRSELRIAVDCLERLNIENHPRASSFREREAVERLCRRSYWTRLWIVQEFVLARDLWIQAGSVVFDPKIFAITCDVLSPEWPPVKLMALRMDDGLVVSQNTSGMTGSDMKSLLYLVGKVREARCSMIQDHIFGVLSLSWQCCQEAVQPDYSKSFAEICELVLQHEKGPLHSEFPISPFNDFNHLNPPRARKDLLLALGFPDAIDKEQLAESDLFQIPGGIWGRIIWMDGSSEIEDPSINPPPHIDQKKLLPLLDFMNKNIVSFDYLPDSSTRQMGELRVGPGQIKVSKSWASLPFPKTREKRKSLLPKFKFLRRKQKVAQQPSDIDNRISDLWNKWQQSMEKHIIKLRSQDLDLFFTDDGRIGYTTRGCKIGDIVCSFIGPYNSPWIVVVDAHEHGVIGKGKLAIERASDFVWGSCELHLDLETMLCFNDTG